MLENCIKKRRSAIRTSTKRTTRLHERILLNHFEGTLLINIPYRTHLKEHDGFDDGFQVGTFGGRIDDSFPACALSFFLSLKVKIHLRTPTLHCRPGSVQSGSASCDDCDRVFLDDLCELVSLIGTHTNPGQHSQHPLTSPH